MKNIDVNNFNLAQFVLMEDADKLLIEVYEPIQKLLFILRNDFQYVMRIFATIDDDHSNKEGVNTLVDLFCHQFYENVLIQTPENEELSILCYLLINKEVDSMNSASGRIFP